MVSGNTHFKYKDSRARIGMWESTHAAPVPSVCHTFIFRELPVKFHELGWADFISWILKTFKTVMTSASAASPPFRHRSPSDHSNSFQSILSFWRKKNNVAWYHLPVFGIADSDLENAPMQCQRQRPSPQNTSGLINEINNSSQSGVLLQHNIWPFFSV